MPSPSEAILKSSLIAAFTFWAFELILNSTLLSSFGSFYFLLLPNGKLLGQTKSDLDILQEKIDLRCDRLETFLSKEQQEQIQFYKTGLEKVYYLQQTLGQQIKDLENNQLNYSDKSLLTNKHQISKKMMCFTLSTSLIMSITAVFSSLKGSTEYQCQSSLEPSKTCIIQSQN